MNVTEFLTHISQQLEAKLGCPVALMPPERRAAPRVWVWLTLDTIIPDDSAGSDLESQWLQLTAYCLVHKNQRNALAVSAQLASNVLACVNRENWNLPEVCERIKKPYAQRETFNVDLRDYTCYAVNAEQQYFRQTPANPETIDTLLIAINPEDRDDPDAYTTRIDTE